LPICCLNLKDKVLVAVILLIRSFCRSAKEKFTKKRYTKKN